MNRYEYANYRWFRYDAAEGRYWYRKWWIYYDPPPIPDRIADWHFVHEDYDGPGDSRCGFASSVAECIRQIEEKISNGL